MALIKCCDCGHSISSKAKLCPKCGGNRDEERLCENTPDTEFLPIKSAEVTAAIAVEPEQAGAAALACQEEGAEEWHYITATGHTGPITLTALQKLATDGEINEHTPVWKAGMPDWVALSQYEEPAEDPPPEEWPPVDSEPSTILWTLALAPAWGTVLQIIVTWLWLSTNHRLSYYAQLWWIMLAANLTASYLDAMNLKKSGQDVPLNNKWSFLLVPAYIYIRDREWTARLINFWIWIASLLLSLSAYMYLNGIYAHLPHK